VTDDKGGAYTEGHGRGLWHVSRDCEFLFGRGVEISLTYALKSDLSACDCTVNEGSYQDHDESDDNGSSNDND